MTRRDVVSHLPFITNELHPLHATALHALKNRAELRRMALLVKKEVGMITPGLANVRALAAKLKASGQEAKIKDLIRRMVQKERGGLVEAEFVSPGPGALYGRVRGSDVVDVGSGTGKKMVQFVGRFASLKCYEPRVKPEVPDWAVIVRARYEGNKEEGLLLSFNVLNQNETVWPWDGFHIVPDLPLWARKGLSAECGGHYVTPYQGGELVEYHHQIPGREFGGYRGVNVYEEETIKLCLAPRLFTSGAIVHPLGYHSRVQEFDPGECSVKLDGEKYEVFVDGIALRARARDGTYYKGKMMRNKGAKFRMKLVIEVCDSGNYLLEVSDYRGFRPYHSLPALAYFCERKHLEFAGKPVHAPPPFDPGKVHPEFEGVVWRVDGGDVLLRAVKSFDVDEANYNIIPKFLNSMSIRARALEPWNRQGIWEVLIMREERDAWVHILRQRKKKTSDCWARMEKIFGTPVMANGTELMKRRLGLVS